MSAPSIASRVGDWWFAPVPTRRLELCRLAVFGYATVWLLIRADYVWSLARLPARRFEPIGVLIGLEAPPSRTLVALVWAVTVVACGLAVAGRALRVSATLSATGVLLISTLASSFGQVFHTEHLLVLHMMILAGASLLNDRSGPTTSGWPLKLMMSVVAVAYVLAGWAKVRYGGWDWVTGESLRSWVAVDNLRKVLLRDSASGLGGWLAGTAWVWAPIAVATLIIELGAPIALVSGPARVVWATSAWLFHVGVLALMAIAFPYQLTGVAYTPFFPLERAEARLRTAAPSALDGYWVSRP
jgi:hypothetical protein